MNPEPKSAKAKSAKTIDPDALLFTLKQVADHPLVRSSITFVMAVKKAAENTPDNPFTGRVTTARLFTTWVLNHKDFVQADWMGRKRSKTEPASDGAPKTATA